jgi:hypothetical protein
MGMYCLNMLAIALELARTRPAYEDVATKFFEHFVYIGDALQHLGEDGFGLWDEKDGFYYDVLQRGNNQHARLKIRSYVGLIPLFAIETLEPDLLDMLPNFRRRMEWFIKYRPQLLENIAPISQPKMGERRLLCIINQEQLTRILRCMLDPAEFLSDYGLRSLSKYHEQHPYSFDLDGVNYDLRYEPAESSTHLFGGNSNWRGPVWYPINYLMIESLQKYHHYYGDDFKVEMPTGSGNYIALDAVASDLSQRLEKIFLKDNNGKRATFGDNDTFQSDAQWRDNIPFYEYFHGDSGAGLGASHQTGWTALVAKLIQQSPIK